MIKILFVTYDFPFPPNSGGKSRAYNLMKYAKTKGVQIYLLSFMRASFDKKWKRELYDIGVSEVGVHKRKKLKSISTISKNILSKDSIFKTLYHDDGFKKKLLNMIEVHNIDVVHFESSYTGYYLKYVKTGKIKTILGTENIEHLLYQDFLKTTNFIQKSILQFQIDRFKREEELMMKLADLSLAVTKDEARYIERISGKKCEVVENGISVKDLSYSFQERTIDNLIFVGNFSYMPNRGAIQYFIRDVMPKLPENITLTIIGKNVSKYVEPSGRIRVKDFVSDLSVEYKNSDALIFPVKIGGGTNFKVLEAMALGVPVVGFADKIESIGARKNKEFFPVENALDFVRQIETIQNKREIVKEVTMSARKLVEENYSWEEIGRKLNTIWKNYK